MSELTTDAQRNQQQSLIKAALRLTDPTANVVVDAQTGHLNVVTVLSRGEVQRILAGLGVSPVDPPSGTSFTQAATVAAAALSSGMAGCARFERLQSLLRRVAGEGRLRKGPG